MVLNFGMLNNSAFKKAINNFCKFQSEKYIHTYQNMLNFMPLVYYVIIYHKQQYTVLAIIGSHLETLGKLAANIQVVL